MADYDKDRIDSEVLAQLGDGHQALLDSIDSLRTLGVALDDLPQIVVVGDKSSGKSSVLEAISRIPFPVKSDVCTRCPTELVMRKEPEHMISVQIIEKSGDLKATISWDHFSNDDLPKIIEEARPLLGIAEGGEDFSTNTLRINVSGPELKHLTLIDLPGIYHNETADENHEGIAIVRGLANYFMAQRNTIILAVVCGNNDLALQKILGMAKTHDPNWERTIGVITKPDIIEMASPMLQKYVRVARNEEPLHVLKLGWHVLRNRTSKENGEADSAAVKSSSEERDQREAEFFNTAPWTMVASENKGVEHLRTKLSRILTKHVEARLPSLIDGMEKRLRSHNDERRKLGEKRDSDSEKRNFLFNIAVQYRDIARAAAHGSYEGTFFSTPRSEGNTSMGGSSDGRMLRAVVRKLNCAFTSVMYTKGARRRIRWDNSQNVNCENKIHKGGCFIEWIGSSETEVQDCQADDTPWTSFFDVTESKVVAWSTLRTELETQAADRRGTEFPGFPNHKLALDLFRDQIQNWQDISHQYIKLVLQAARAFVQQALGYILGTNKNTQEALQHKYIGKFFMEREKELVDKLEELICHYREGSALCLEAEFERRMQERNALHTALHVKSLLSSGQDVDDSHNLSIKSVFNKLKNSPPVKADSFGSETVVEMMAVYYDMSMRTFTENTIILATENCLMKEIPKLLKEIADHSISMEVVNSLAAESATTTQNRLRLSSEIAALEKGLQICERYKSWDSLGQRVAVTHPANLDTKATMGTFTQPEKNTTDPKAKLSPSGESKSNSLTSPSPSPVSSAPKNVLSDEVNTHSPPPSSLFSSVADNNSTGSKLFSVGGSISTAAQSSSPSPSPLGRPPLNSGLSSQQSTFGSGSNSSQSTAAPADKGVGLFGSSATQSAGGLFAPTPAAPADRGVGLFGSSATQSTGGLFAPTPAAPADKGVGFGASATQSTGGLFGQAPSNPALRQKDATPGRVLEKNSSAGDL